MFSKSSSSFYHHKVAEPYPLLVETLSSLVAIRSFQPYMLIHDPVYVLYSRTLIRLSTGDRERPNARSGKVGTPIFIPSIFLRADRPCGPPSLIVFHTVINNPVFSAIGTFRKASMADPIDMFIRVLVEYAAFGMFVPRRRVHGIVTD